MCARSFSPSRLCRCCCCYCCVNGSAVVVVVWLDRLLRTLSCPDAVPRPAAAATASRSHRDRECARVESDQTKRGRRRPESCVGTSPGNRRVAGTASNNNNTIIQIIVMQNKGKSGGGGECYETNNAQRKRNPAILQTRQPHTNTHHSLTSIPTSSSAVASSATTLSHAVWTGSPTFFVVALSKLLRWCGKRSRSSESSSSSRDVGDE